MKKSNKRYRKELVNEVIREVMDSGFGKGITTGVFTIDEFWTTLVSEFNRKEVEVFEIDDLMINKEEELLKEMKEVFAKFIRKEFIKT